MSDRMVQTTKGLLPESSLRMAYINDYGPNSIGVAREWYLGDELVRRDAWVTLLAGAPAESDAGVLTNG